MRIHLIITSTQTDDCGGIFMFHGKKEASHDTGHDMRATDALLDDVADMMRLQLMLFNSAEVKK